MRFAAFVICALISAHLPSAPALAQSGDPKRAEQKPGADVAAARERQKKVDEIMEAGRLVGGAGGEPECVWIGRRVIGLLWRDDLDTAFRHMDLYDRFGCPTERVQAAFRCLIRNGNIDPKAQETLIGRIHACWIDPAQPAAAAAAEAPAPTVGTTPR